jgi:hypothetical protein
MSTGAAITYDVVIRSPDGRERVQEYATPDGLAPGAVLRLRGRYWLVEAIEESAERPRAVAKPARYRLRLRRPDGREELGAFRRFRPGSPRLGHTFTTLEAGYPISWQVGAEQLARLDDGEPYLDLVAERDYAELEGEAPDHELEHTLERRLAAGLPAGAEATLSRATELGLNMELVALEPGEAPDWAEAIRYVDALIFEEIEDDLFERCGVDVDADPKDTWLATVKERLRSDLDAFRTDIDGEHDQVEEWDFLDGRIFATVGTYEDEFDPNSGHGWMCRLLDGGALGIAGFERVRKPELDVEGSP